MLQADEAALPNPSLDRTGDAAEKARDSRDVDSKKALCWNEPRPLSSQPLGSLFMGEHGRSAIEVATPSAKASTLLNGNLFSMLQQLKLIALVVLPFLFIVSCSLGRDEPVGQTDARGFLNVRGLDTDGDTKIVIKGFVLENNFGCDVDVACFLRIEVEGLETSVTYHYGEWPPCENTSAIRQGLAALEGELVEVYAEIVDGDWLTTCSSSEFYIRSLPSD